MEEQGSPSPTWAKVKEMDAELKDLLIHEAEQARANAYAPYSVYRVGAAILDEEGRVHVGVNVENISFGLTVCAERNAVGAMAAAGGREIKAVAVATRDGGTPCGACRQVLAEFAPDPARVLVIGKGESHQWEANLADLLPGGFTTQLKKEP